MHKLTIAQAEMIYKALNVATVAADGKEKYFKNEDTGKQVNIHVKEQS